MSKTPYSGSNTRKNILAFLIGKVPTAILTAAILGLSVRLLPVAEFGRYVVLMAMLEITLGLSTLGLDWVILRYLPAYRMNQCRSGAVRMILMVVLSRFCVLAIIASVIFLLRDTFFSLIGSDFPFDLLPLFAVLLVVEGVMRILRDNTLEALAMQRWLQVIISIKGGLIVAALFCLKQHQMATAQDLLLVEIMAALVSLLLATVIVSGLLRQIGETQSEWSQPSWRQIRKVALNNYGSGIVEYLYSPSFLLVVLSRVQTAEALAGLGFVLRLTDIIRNYLPGMMLFGVVRSRMIGAYASNQNYGELGGWAGFVFKISVLTLVPIFGIIFVYGSEVLVFAGGKQYAEFNMVFSALCCWLAFRLHRMILGTVCNAIELTQVWVRASLASVLVLPLMYFFLYEQLGVWFVVIALFANELIVNVLVVAGMRRRGYVWDIGWGWMAKVVVILMLACLPAYLVKGEGALLLMAGIVLLNLLLLAGLFAFQVFDKNDRTFVNRGLGRNVFKVT